MTPLDVVKYIGAPIYSIIASVSIFFLGRSLSKNRGWTKQASFFLFGALHLLVRATLFFLPSSVYLFILRKFPERWSNVFMVFLDLLPESLFFAVFILLVSTWAQLYIRSLQSNRFTKRQYVITIVLGMGSIALSNGCMYLIAAFSGLNYNTLCVWEARWNAIICVVLLASFVFVGWTARRRLSHSALLAGSPLIASQTRKVGWTTVIISVALVLRAVYINILNDLFYSLVFQGKLSDLALALIFLFYFVVTEMVPETLIMCITIATFGIKKRAPDPRTTSTAGSSRRNRPAARRKPATGLLGDAGGEAELTGMRVGFLDALRDYEDDDGTAAAPGGL
ncbi:hypothetical protein PAPYR_6732 [Paratrimastix pyriformis]|uniref:THH1/TOM1/TOM3 domain-containing protein n=1 Tax=Paratrimastix pyriformis TaxID=342808 RepID=A0ABQ8UG06_9EUKA|nr:hypothetical protein PAPYR_6732 [Paratrimastix pyriformis]